MRVPRDAGNETRERLITTAERLFAEQGVTVSNRQVGEAARQANTAVVAYHFGTKADLVRAIVRRGAMTLPAVIVVGLIALHLTAVVYLFRINRGLDITADDIYRGHGRVVISAVLVVAGILASLWFATARRSFA